MKRITIWVIFFSVFLLLHTTTCVEDEVKSSLINFLAKLSNNKGKSGLLLGWNSSSDPCKDHWKAVTCDTRNNFVRKLFLNSSNLVGELDIGLLCNVERIAESLTVLHLESNDISGVLSPDVASCKQLTRLHLNGNRLNGTLPTSLAMLNNLKILDVSNNKLYGTLPDLSRISGLTVFLAQNNEISGEIPRFDFSNLKQFNVSNNNINGVVPDVRGYFTASSFLGNPGLCGDPLPNKCPSSLQAESVAGESKDSSKDQIFMFVGYLTLALVFVVIIIVVLCKRRRKKKVVDALPQKEEAIEDGQDERMYKSSTIESMGYKAGFSKSETSFVSADNSALVSSSLVVLTSPEVNGLKFEDLLKAPAEMLGRGKNGSVYKVILDNRKTLVVKRIKNWPISSHEFKQRMQRLDQVKHPNVLPPLAFYSSKQEKLLVYEYQQNGSLFELLHGTHMPKTFDWPSRLGVAASIVEAMAFMHQELQDDGIAHGNLKSSNIFLNRNMEPCISKYGLIPVITRSSSPKAFKDDVFGFGMILLELLTGNLVQHNGVDLQDWVHSVLREEWTAEVFDKSLMSECASEERLVSLLQVAIKCVNPSPEARPTMNQVVVMINKIKEEEERSAIGPYSL